MQGSADVDASTAAEKKLLADFNGVQPQRMTASSPWHRTRRVGIVLTAIVLLAIVATTVVAFIGAGQRDAQAEADALNSTEVVEELLDKNPAGFYRAGRTRGESMVDPIRSESQAASDVTNITSSTGFVFPSDDEICRWPIYIRVTCDYFADRWYFDSFSGKCRIYAGCDGNWNDYYSRRDCEETCGHLGADLASPRVFDEYALREVVVSVTRPTSTQVTFQCPVAGSAEPTITWLKDDYPSTLQLYKIDDPAYDLPDRFSILDGGRRLLLKAEGAGDSGRYACIARSSDGVTYSEVKLTVVEKPRIEPTAETLTATSTRSIDLFCDLLTRDSQVTIEWLKDDRPIEASNARYQLLYHGEKLLIYPVETTDSARWTCVARNSAGEARKEIQLAVNERANKGIQHKMQYRQ
ncbi:Protein HIM-4 a [Aphelenchoides avenae]|nr:Protein HIM-4 a [Aphelenchus avenae]